MRAISSEHFSSESYDENISIQDLPDQFTDTLAQTPTADVGAHNRACVPTCANTYVCA